MATDAKIQVMPDSTGAKVDTSEVTQAGGTVVERQRVNLSDPSDPNAHATVRGPTDGGRLLVSTQLEVQQEILRTLQRIEQLLMNVASQ